MMSLLNNDTHIYLKVNITIQIMKILCQQGTGIDR